MKKILLSLVISISLSLLPTIVFAQDLGTIKPPPGTPTGGNDPSGFVANFVRGGINLLVIVAFVIALIWMIFAGYSFIFAGDDPKKISSAWSRIYWGLLGLIIVGGAYALVRLAEIFLGVDIVTGDFKLPQQGSP